MLKADIVDEIYDLSEIISMVNEAQEDVELMVNSQGGSAIEALQLMNAIKKSQQSVTARVEVMAMSAAAVIALGCKKVQMDKQAIIMLHNCWTFTIGNAKDLEQEAEACRAVDNALQAIVTTYCTEENAAYIKERMDNGELWLTGEDCAELFDNVELVETAPQEEGKKAAHGNLAKLVAEYNALKKMLDEPKPEPDEPPDEDEGEDKDEQEGKEPEKKAYTVPDAIRAIIDEVL